jgi:hypothetical protein
LILGARYLGLSRGLHRTESGLGFLKRTAQRRAGSPERTPTMDTQIEQVTTTEIDEFIDKLEPSAWKSLVDRLKAIMGNTEPVHRISLGLLVAILALIISIDRQVISLGSRVNNQDAKLTSVELANLHTTEQVAVLKKQLEIVERRAAVSERRIAKLRAQVGAIQKLQTDQNGRTSENPAPEPKIKPLQTLWSQ